MQVSHTQGLSIDYFYTYNLGNIIRCTDKLGIPWHPIEKKGHDFAFLATYVGFDWDLHAQTVSLPERKCSKYAARVAACLDAAKVSLDEVMKIQGTLKHATFVITAGSSYLPSLSQAIKAFGGDRHRRHHITQEVHLDLCWWQSILSGQGISRSFLPHLHLDPDVWVDTTMSWGIGLVVKGCWAAWKLLEGWRARDGDISWAKTIAMELVLLQAFATQRS